MRPMLATPTTRVPAGPAWRHEIKWDGIRAITSVNSGRLTIRTRSGADCTARFPEIAASHLDGLDGLTIDGEIVALKEGRPDFRTVMQRLAPKGGLRHLKAASPQEAAETTAVPVSYMVFDILSAGGHDLTSMPWSQRRRLLDGIDLAGGAIVVPPSYEDGEALFRATVHDGIEGIVSKQVNAPYRPGIRSEEWLKSVHRRTDSFVVGGWRPVEGSIGSLGALLVGESTDEGLRYRGRVGTGFSRRSGAALLEHLTPTPEPPFVHPEDELPAEDLAGTHWVRPELVVDVAYLARSHGGRLRQPSYKGMRLDLGVRRA